MPCWRAKRALNAHFKRQGVAARAQFIGHGFRARYKLPDIQPTVSIIIPTRNAVGWFDLH
ncbi:MAG: hypothetical protein R3E42_05485 [Burkholderiaceae bacterium]